MVVGTNQAFMGTNQDGITLEKFETAKEELKRLHEVRGKEAMFRSKMKWVEQGEKPTKYFYNLEKTNYEKKTDPRGETRK